MDKKQEFIELSWKILESKYIYYTLSGNHPLAITDAEFDRIQKRYIELAQELDFIPTATSMVGFDQTTPSAQLVMTKIDNYKP